MITIMLILIFFVFLCTSFIYARYPESCYMRMHARVLHNSFLFPTPRVSPDSIPSKFQEIPLPIIENTSTGILQEPPRRDKE